uniref:Oxygen sensor histidine kinase NreB n=1 Tax=Thermosporothrix sp. COM3 TaxID=2490863 RepID=A0A455SHT5_9CHLR|nr:hypothetical protein KTC_12400 [Thermosporothrix sp. COM3]
MGVATYLVVSHLVAAGAALSMVALLLHFGVSIVLTLLLACVAGMLVGWLLTLPLQSHLSMLELALARLAHGFAVEPLRTAMRWPVGPFYAIANAVSQRIGRYEQQAYLTAELRDQALRQAAEVAAQEERNRIARDLHDSVKQQLFSINMSAAAARAHGGGDNAEVQAAIVDIQRSVKEAQVEMQALLQQLHSSPLEQTGLAEALRMQAQALGYRTGAQVHTEIEPLPAGTVLSTAEQIFRLVQEAFANIARHARAGEVWLQLTTRGEWLHIEVRDNGQGFDPATVKQGMGLSNVRERVELLGGQLEIQSSPGQGTTLRARIPLLDTRALEHEQEQMQRETGKATEQAKSGLQLGASAVQATFLFMLLATLFGRSGILAIVCLLIGLLVVLSACIWGQVASFRVLINNGGQSRDSLSLLRRVHALWLKLLRLCIMGSWFSFIMVEGWRYPVAWWITFTLTIISCILLVVEHKRYYGIINRYFEKLLESGLRWQIAQEWGKLMQKMRGFLLWPLFVVALLLLGMITVSFPPSTARDWAGYALIALVLFRSVTLFIDYVQLKRWKQYTEEE